MPSFFDSALVEKNGAAFICEDKLDEGLRRLIPNAHITKGSFTYPGAAAQRDLVWNHMDQNHRPLIHRTYGDAMRIAISKQTAFSLTRFGRWPILIPVFDGHHKDNGFYQVLSLFGLLIVVCIIECNAQGDETRMDISWTIASHRLLRFFHGPLNRRLMRLNEVQNREDDVMRRRRAELRAAGYRFTTDVPNFINSNIVANNVLFPALSVPQSVRLSDLPEGRPHRVEVENRSYVVRRTNGAVEVWPGVCPHEGAALGPADLHGAVVRCPWHGLEFPRRMLASNSPAVTVCGARVQVVESELRIS